MNIAEDNFVRDGKSIKAKFTDDGFVLVKNCINRSLISRIRKLHYEFFLKRGIDNSNYTSHIIQNGFNEGPFISLVFTQPLIKHIFLEILGSNELLLTQHADIQRSIIAKWHKDDGTSLYKGGYFGAELYDDPDVYVVKAAIYLQDHLEFDDGLSVRIGSHQFKNHNEGKKLDIRSKAGDVIFFDPRITHCGQFNETPNRIGEQSNSYSKSNDEIGIKHDDHKCAIFFTACKYCDISLNFAINNMRRQLKQRASSSHEAYMEDRLKQLLSNYGIKTIDEYPGWKKAFPEPMKFCI